MDYSIPDFSIARRPSARSFGLSLLAACVLAGPATAAQYSWQVSAVYTDTETGPRVDTDNVGVAATRYFSPIDDSEGPSALAAFLSRSSSLGISGFDNDERQTIPLGPTAGGQTLAMHNGLDGFSVTGRYVWRQSGWYAGGGFDLADGEQGTVQSPNLADVHGYRATAGKYLGESTSLELTFGTAETEVDQTPSFVCSVFVIGCITEVETQADDLTLRAFHVGRLGRMRYSLDGSVTTTEIDLDFRSAAPPPPPQPPPFPTTPGPIFGGGGVFVAVPVPPSTVAPTLVADFDTYSLAAELFPTPRLGVRVGYVSWRDNPERDEGYDVTATWFFVPRVAARVSLAHIVRRSFFTEIPDSRAGALEIIGRF